ncbi:hypothetical protein IEQ34_011791 [Dendrobium chrysotoxum]|uniref:Uncharacterized protein n=1 Tax=Dendrobium chrysotoxum TaxID=161865 RepID=A0AAV7GS63_DENCH|nr:hypothetical protein IEQ34_011791 [Dendrobium chrysotoxum]
MTAIVRLRSFRPPLPDNGLSDLHRPSTTDLARLRSFRPPSPTDYDLLPPDSSSTTAGLPPVSEIKKALVLFFLIFSAKFSRLVLYTPAAPGAQGTKS